MHIAHTASENQLQHIQTKIITEIEAEFSGTNNIFGTVYTEQSNTPAFQMKMQLLD